MNIGRLFRFLVYVALVCFCARAESVSSKRVVTTMTRNMDAGTDFDLLFAAYPNIPLGVSATIEEVIATDIPGRAARLADEIRTTHPDLIALQEVTEWRQGACSSTALLYDQLQLLMDALEARQMKYKVLAYQPLVTIEAPASTGGCVQTTDHNAILVVENEHAAGIEISNVQMARYAAALDLSSVGLMGIPPIYSGYIEADVEAGGDRFRFVNTHLASTYPAFDPHGLIQVAQAAELLTVLGQTQLPVVLCGDFNSNAESGFEQTATAGMILDAGFVDVWRQFNPMGTGYTWPLYDEDPLGPSVPNERIDLIFTRGVRALKVEQTGLKEPFASDHAGVAAMLQSGK